MALYNDVYLAIFSYLDWFDSTNVKMSCRLFNKLISDEVLEQKAKLIVDRLDKVCEAVSEKSKDNTHCYHNPKVRGNNKDKCCNHFSTNVSGIDNKFCCPKIYIPRILSIRIDVLEQDRKSLNYCNCTNLPKISNSGQYLYIIRKYKNNHITLKNVIKVMFDKLIITKYKDNGKQSDYILNVRKFCFNKFNHDLVKI